MKRSPSPGPHQSSVKHQKADPYEGVPNLPSSLNAPVSPPRRRSTIDKSRNRQRESSFQREIKISDHDSRHGPSLAAIEAGEVQIGGHLSLFSTRLRQAVASRSDFSIPLQLSIPNWMDLYLRNQHPHGRHFVIHQHDHPIAGPHYDLRLQFSETSSLSWAIMYGLPGNPNSRKINRNATETRVHCLWNYLIETGSAETGSMIIWDTGEYSILPYYPEQQAPETDDSRSDISDLSVPLMKQPSESEKLQEAFQHRKIRLRLHGAKLPSNYTISLRLSTEDDMAARLRSTRSIPHKRRRRMVLRSRPTSTPSASPSPPAAGRPLRKSSGATPQTNEDDEQDGASASDEEDLDERTRLTNAYPGATNFIGSIHQRRWFITLDRLNSGFERSTTADDRQKRWIRKRNDGEDQLLGFDPFYVRGPDIERSVVTGRTGNDVLQDEGVKGFVPRQGWRAVLE